MFPYPDTMIKIFKLNQSKYLLGDKIQGIVQIIASYLNNPLKHISGYEIAEGNLDHLKNLLELLLAVSRNFINKSYRNEVQSNPENKNS